MQSFLWRNILVQGNARAARATVVSAFKRTFLHLRPPSSRNLCNVIEHINAPKETFPKKFSVETKNLIRRGGSGGTIDNAQRKKKVFIGNLSPWITEDDLLEHFRPIGNIKSIKILRREDNSSKRCALVDFATHESVVRAVSELHKSILCQHTIIVRPDFYSKGDRRSADKSLDSSERKARTSIFPAPRTTPAGGPLNGDARHSRSLQAIVNKSYSVFVGNLSPELNESGLRDHFECLGGYGVVSAQVFMSRSKPPRSKCCGKVVFWEGTHISDVIRRMNGSELGGRKLLVKQDDPEEDRVKPGATGKDIKRGSSHSKARYLTRSVQWNAEEKSIELIELEGSSSCDELDSSRSIYVSNLSFNVTQKRLVQFLVNDMIMTDQKMELAVTKVKKVRFMLDAMGQSRGRAFVEFDNAESARDTAERVHRSPLQGRHVYARTMNEL